MDATSTRPLLCGHQWMTAGDRVHVCVRPLHAGSCRCRCGEERGQ